jgi:hypothetical protein
MGVRKNTTIMVSLDLKKELNDLKLYPNETYEDIISDLIEDRKFLTEETLKEIEISRKEYSAGKYVTLEQVKKEAGLENV